MRFGNIALKESKLYFNKIQFTKFYVLDKIMPSVAKTMCLKMYETFSTVKSALNFQYYLVLYNNEHFRKLIALIRDKSNKSKNAI